MELVPPDRIRAIEEQQWVVTGLLRAAYEDLEIADGTLGRKWNLEPLLDVVAGAGRMSHDLASPSAETHEGLSVPLVGFCGETPADAWTPAAVRAGYAASSRLRQLARLLESFTLHEAYETVGLALRETQAAGGAPPEVEASLSRAESRLGEALQVYMTGVAEPFARLLAEGAERLADEAVVAELCKQREVASPAAREDRSAGRGEEDDIPDLGAAGEIRDGALRTIRSTLATLDAFVLPKDSSPLRVAQGFTGPVRTKAVEPVYTSFARRACLQGEVRLELALDHEGIPQRIRVLSGSPELAEAAVTAAGQWRFEPASLDGEPIAFEYRLTVNFDLKGAEATRCRQLRAASN